MFKRKNNEALLVYRSYKILDFAIKSPNLLKFQTSTVIFRYN